MQRSDVGCAQNWHGGTPALLQLANFGGKDEVAFSEAIDAVGTNLDAGLAPGEIDVWMMVLLLSDFPDAIDKIQGAAEVHNLVFSFKALFVQDTPAAVKLALHFFQGIAFERRGFTLARLAFFLGKFRTHIFPSKTRINKMT